MDSKRKLNLDAVRSCLRRIRLEAGFTQAQLAQACGVGEKTVSSYECADRINLEYLGAIVTTCGHTMAEFFAAVEAETDTMEADRRAHEEHARFVEMSRYPTAQSSLGSAWRM